METKRVSARAVGRELGIPFWEIFRLAERGKIPYEVTKTYPWSDQRRLLFDIDAVRTALEQLGKREPVSA